MIIFFIHIKPGSVHVDVDHLLFYDIQLLHLKLLVLYKDKELIIIFCLQRKYIIGNN